MENALVSRPFEAPSTAQKERDLVERYRRADPEAFDEFYRQFSAMIYNLCLRQSGAPETAQDLSQEIFLKIFRSLARFRSQSSLKTWAYRIAINHCRSRRGRRRLEAVSLTRDDGEVIDVADPRRGPEDRALAASESERLARALLDVEPRFREAVVLRDLEDLNYQEIAEVLRVPIGTVRSRIARGRDQLRQILEGVS